MLVEIVKFGREERVAVTSLDVAETFGKEHKNILRDIRGLGCSEEFNRLNFEPISYTDSMNRQHEAIVMTRDGFTLLVMGYTGELAMKFKEGIPVVFHRGNRQSWRVTMALDNWLTLYAAAIGKNQENTGKVRSKP